MRSTLILAATAMVALAGAAALAGCGDDGHSSDGSGDDGIDAATTTDGPGALLDAGLTQCGTLHAVIRDFKIEHPDFEPDGSMDVVVPGLVAPTITPGGTPTLSTNPPALGLITSAATFAQWYTDVPGTNQKFDRDLVLDETSPGVFVYDRAEYFPIDGEGFGNEGNAHNFHFTTELHADFTYGGGERFTFRGDDDVWVFVNGKLAIDIGGVHNANERSIDFDAQASALGITVGGSYAIDFFQAERHTVKSSFRIETSIGCFLIGRAAP